jgi:exonuclease VII large subunit
MSTNSLDPSGQPRRAKSHTVILVLLSLGMALALAGNMYQFVTGQRMQRDVVMLQKSTQSQIAKLSDAAAATFEENQQRFDAIRNQLQDSTAASLKQAKSEAKRASSQLQQKLEQKHKEVVSQLSDLKEDTSSKLTQVSDNLEKVHGDLDKTGTDLKRVMGDLGVMSGEVATNSKELATLKDLGARNYFEFDLTKTKQPQKVGDIRILLKKTDPKRNRYTLEVLADDKTVEKRDKTINEPVQLYVAGSRQPYEIVVNQVKKNEVVGYLATPKVRVARGEASE